LILIRATRILLKQKGIGDLILALHLRAGDSQQTDQRGQCTGPAWWCYRGLTRASHPSSPGHDDAGFSGQNNVGVNGVLTQGKTWRGTAPIWLMVAASLLQAWPTTSGGSSTLPASRSSPMSSSWPPLTSRLVQWLQSATNSSNLVAARVRQVSSFVRKI
jgi:hypothetical protein